MVFLLFIIDLNDLVCVEVLAFNISTQMNVHMVYLR